MLKNTLGWGTILWAFGYLLGMILFSFVPQSMLGWVIMPIGTVATVWVLWKKITTHSLREDLGLAVSWGAIAIIGDYVFLVRLLHPVDGYYKLDVYVYYILTFFLPILVGAIRRVHGLKRNEKTTQ